MCCTRVAWVYLLSCEEEGSSLVFAINEESDMGLYEVPWSMSLLGFWMGTMLANFQMCYIVVKSSCQHAREECESKSAYVFSVPDV